MIKDFLANVELYFSSTKIHDNKIIVEGDELHHIKNVMRHKSKDIIYITDGLGKIYKCIIDLITNEKAECLIEQIFSYENKLSNIVFCIPRLKSQDRFEFAIEKCVELGITNFLFFESERTVAKGIKLERIQKLLLSAMKQSIRSWLPKIYYVKKLDELNDYDGEKILFDQKSNQRFFNYVIENKEVLKTKKIYLIFGPEGGLSKQEVESFDSQKILRLTENRLRSETAIVTAASILSTAIQ